jgi:hypothetical protein
MSWALNLFRALWLGAKLRRSATWKDVGAFVAVFSPFLALLGKLAAGAGWLPGEFTRQEIDDVSQWVWQFSGLVLAYWFRATSADVGWGWRQEIGVYPDAEPDDVLAPESAGVLHRVPWLRVSPDASSRCHPGDDPGLDSFNR